MLLLIGTGCGDGDGGRAESLPSPGIGSPAPSATKTPVPTDTNTPTPPDKPVVNIQFVGAADLSDESKFSLADVIESIQASVVQIIAGGSSGSGFIVGTDGLVVTNEHVVDNARTVRVWLTNGRSYKGDVLERDTASDLALVKIGGNQRFDAITVGDPGRVRVGDEVLALGFPLADRIGNDLTVTRGIVSSKRTEGGVKQFQTDAAINPGNSGGPLVNSDGEVIGVNTSKIEETSGGRPVDNIGFAVSVSEIEGRLPTLGARGVVNRGTPMPTPTATMTPTITPTPATTPTPAISLTPTHTPKPTPTTATNMWHSATLGGGVDSPMIVVSSLGVNPLDTPVESWGQILAVGCGLPANGLFVFIGWNKGVGSISSLPDVSLTFDDGRPQIGTWIWMGRDEDADATIVLNPLPVIESLKSADRLTANLRTDEDEKPISTSWIVTGFEDAIMPIEEQCSELGEAAPAAMAEVGKPAPDFTLKVYENDNFTKDQEVSLSDLRGKPVVITFWFPACTQCQELMFHLKDSYNQNKDNVHYVAIQVSAESKSAWDPSGSDAASGQDYVTVKELHFVVGGDFDRSIATQYGVDAYPTTYFLDKDLNLVSSAEYLRARQIKDNIELASQ